MKSVCIKLYLITLFIICFTVVLQAQELSKGKVARCSKCDQDSSATWHLCFRRLRF